MKSEVHLHRHDGWIPHLVPGQTFQKQPVVARYLFWRQMRLKLVYCHWFPTPWSRTNQVWIGHCAIINFAGTISHKAVWAILVSYRLTTETDFDEWSSPDFLASFQESLVLARLKALMCSVISLMSAGSSNISVLELRFVPQNHALAWLIPNLYTRWCCDDLSGRKG